MKEERRKKGEVVGNLEDDDGSDAGTEEDLGKRKRVPPPDVQQSGIIQMI